MAAALQATAEHVPPESVVHQRQIVNHGVEHRTNITTILGALGVALPEVDGWSYMWANRDRLGAGEEA